MSTNSISRTNFLTFSSNGSRPPHKKFHKIFSLAPTMKMNTKSIGRVRKEYLSIQPRTSSITHLENSRSSNLRFDRLQLSDQDLDQDKKLEFGKFVAREAILDEELWTAAYLRAECHWENRPGERYVDNCKRNFCDQEFNALKKRCKGQLGQTNKCVVAVRKEDRNVKRTVIKSVVGTLDFSIRRLLHGESFPGERQKYCFPRINTARLEKYVYVSNLCIQKSARRQSIASNMLRFVIESARLSGIESVYVHVHRNNEPALELYRKIGFQVVEMANSQLLEEQMYLLCYRT